MTNPPTLLAIGAHADDCPFGLPGTMLLAARAGYRVVICNLIGQIASGIAERIAEINRTHGAETRYLPFASGKLDDTTAMKTAVAEVVADVKPALGFYLWPKDTHADHVTASPVCHGALQLAGRILGRTEVAQVWRRYTYDNGPHHTIDFAPNTFVDITAVWPEARTWVGEVSAAYGGETLDRETPHPAQRTKEVLSAYRGLACGVEYAEAFHTSSPERALLFAGH